MSLKTSTNINNSDRADILVATDILSNEISKIEGIIPQFQTIPETIKKTLDEIKNTEVNIENIADQQVKKVEAISKRFESNTSNISLIGSKITLAVGVVVGLGVGLLCSSLLTLYTLGKVASAQKKMDEVYEQYTTEKNRNMRLEELILQQQKDIASEKNMRARLNDFIVQSIYRGDVKKAQSDISKYEASQR